MNIPKIKHTDILSLKMKIESLQNECDRLFETLCKNNGIEDQDIKDFIFDMAYNGFDHDFNHPGLKGRLEIIKNFED